MTGPAIPTHVRLVADGLRYGFKERPDFFGPVSMTVAPGDLWAILGPNGAGKSTLMRLLAGLHRPHGGTVTIGGASLAGLPPRTRARQVAFVPQNIQVDTGMSVRDLVLLGRFPHRALALFESAADQRIAQDAMNATRTLEFADRAVATLSGGEAQRVHLAAAFAQSPAVLLLDEPTASLDLKHQLDLFHILRERAQRDRLAVVVVTHDVNMAAMFATHVILLNDGKVAAMGAPDLVLTPEVLQPVYGVTLIALTAARAPGHRWLAPVDVPEGGNR